MIYLIFSLSVMASPAAGIGFNASSDREVYVFGTITVDFIHKAEAAGRIKGLSDCSTAEYFCADGEVFNVVLPKACGVIHPGMSWRAGKLETIVLGRDRSPREAGRGTARRSRSRYYLQTSEYPEIVYVYSPDAGVTSIFYDPRKRIDFVGAARSGRLATLEQEVLQDPTTKWSVRPLATLDSFGVCRK